MTPSALDVHVNDRHVGTLVQEAGNLVFTYLPDTPPECLVSLLMPVRAQSYVWKGLHPVFLMNLPEGYKKDRIRQVLGPHADVSDLGLLALTGANSIGRIRVVPHGVRPDALHLKTDVAGLLASTDSRRNLLRLMDEDVTEGVSGVMPKRLAFPEGRATVRTDDYILKTGFDDIPWLSLNEYLCLEVARAAKLEVPQTRISDDGQVLAIGRFDSGADGGRIATEDFCALKGLDPVDKYRRGSLEDLAKLCKIYLAPEIRKDSLRRLHRLLLLNHALRNADAHLKNFSLIYSRADDARLAPVYDVVTVTIYPRYRENLPALPLRGKRVWASGKLLADYGAAWLGLDAEDLRDGVTAIRQAVEQVLPRVDAFANRFPGFRETAKQMVDAWAEGLGDIAPDARPGRSQAVALRGQTALSDLREAEPLREKNPYRNPDGAFGHKAR